jgi:nucleotide-binding universal stress UspA family protein
MRNVLAAIDSDACAQPVLGTSIALGRLFGADPVALHVRERGIPSPEELAREAGVEYREVTGEPIEQIVVAARTPATVAVVVGTRGMPEGPQPAGHTALEVVTQVSKPLAVVPPHARPPEQFARLLLPLNGSAEASGALDEMVRLARERHVELLVLHVHSPTTVPAFADHEPHATEAWDREFLRRHVVAPEEEVTLLRHTGVPAIAVAAVAEETNVELVILAWSQNLSEGRARVVSETLARSRIPVLLLPTLPGRRENEPWAAAQ